MKDTFRFSAPVAFSKGVEGDDSAPAKMVIGGIASTNTQDFDGEFLNPKGFDVSYFEKFGYINWAHQSTKDPSSIIGRPSKITIDKKTNEMYLEATLFKSSEKANQVYKLGEILEQEGHALAFSIEGKVTDRDKKDPRKVLGAKITGVAITPTPKNNDSVATIIKGLDDDDFNIVKGMYSAFEKEVNSDDVENDDEEEDGAEKSMTAASVSPVTKESVQSKLKITVDKLSKGQVMTILREDFPNTSNEMLEDIFKLTLKIEKSVIMEKPEISPEALSKAYETLGMSKGVEAEAPASEEETPAAEEVVEEVVAEVAPVEEVVEEEVVEKSTDGGPSEEAIEASKTILKSVGFEISEKKEEVAAEAAVEEVIEKSVEATPTEGFSAILSEQLGDLAKGFNGKFGAVATLLSASDSKSKKLESDIEVLKKSIEDFGNLSQGRKSVQTAAFIEKGIEANSPAPAQASGRVLSLSNPQHKEQILRMADDATGISKGNITDHALANSVVLYEQTNTCNDILQECMKKAGFNLVK